MTSFYNNRNQALWISSTRQRAAWLIGYLIAGDPSIQKSIQLIKQAFQSGLDVLELGVPSHNPYLDGAVIERGHQRVIDAKGHEEWLLEFWQCVRQEVDQPIWAMGYQTDLLETGLYQSLIQNQLIDALIIPDCEYEALVQLENELQNEEVDVVRFVHPEMSDQEVAQICHGATIIYAQSYQGKTGKDDPHNKDVTDFYQRVRAHTNAFIMQGFGLRTPEMVSHAVASGFQGAVVGSVLVEQVENEQEQVLFRMIRQMKQEIIQVKRGE